MLYDGDFVLRLEEALRAALPAWGLAADAPLALLTVSENATFLAGEGHERRVLRVYRPGYHAEAEIRSELAWIEALRAEGMVDTPPPLRTAEGNLLVPLRDGEARRLACAFGHVPGREPDAAAEGPRWHAELGRIAARLHAHARRWRRPASFRRKRWAFETIVGASAYWGDWRAALGLDPAGRALLERLHARLEADCAAYGEGPDRFGLVHGDMRAANLLVGGDALSVIDFDDCGFSWFGYDFAASVSFIEHEPVVPELMAAWLAGYRAVAPFAREHERALPMLVMLRRLQLTAWIASHAETPTARGLGAGFTAGTLALAETFLRQPPLAAAA